MDGTAGTGNAVAPAPQVSLSLSVIIPVYNRQQLGERAIRSALVQGVAQVEILVVDDCSTPPFELPEELRTRPDVRLIRHAENRGESAARNTGIAAARAPWIAFLDSDDYWLPGTLGPRFAWAQQEFAARPDPLVAYAAGFVLDRKSEGRREARIPLAGSDVMDFASGCWFSQGSTGILRKDVYATIGPCDPRLRRIQDFEWFLRFALAGGRLRVWQGLAAVLEIQGKPKIAVLEESARLVRAKFADPDGTYRLPPAVLRRLDAYLDVERASIWMANRAWIKGAFYLARSLLRVPRRTVHLKRFWQISSG